MKIDPFQMTSLRTASLEPRPRRWKRLVLGFAVFAVGLLALATWLFSCLRIEQGKHGIAAIGGPPASYWIPVLWIPRRLQPWLERPVYITHVAFHTDCGDPQEGLRRLGTRTSVRSVSYAGRFHSPDMLPLLAQTFPLLQGLQIRGTSPLSPADCRAMQQMTQLQTLAVETPVEPGGMAELGRHPNAKQLRWNFDLRGTSEASLRELAELSATRLRLVVSPPDFLMIAKGIDASSTPLPNLVHLAVDLGSSPTVRPVSPKMNAAMKSLTRLPRLTHLSLSNCGVDDSGVLHLESLSGLQNLDLAHSRVTDVGCRSLSKLSNLHALNLGDSQITIAGVRELRTLTLMRALSIKSCSKLPRQANLSLPPEFSKGNVKW